MTVDVPTAAAAAAVPRPGRKRRALARAVVTVLAITAAAWLWPAKLGGHTTFIAVHGVSMQPAFQNGDLVVARAQGRYEVGDVVVFRAPGAGGRSANVVHRIIAMHDDGSVSTQGDNRDTSDGFRTAAADIVGRANGRIPHAATVLLVLSRWWLLALITGLLVTMRLWPEQQR